MTSGTVCSRTQQWISARILVGSLVVREELNVLLLERVALLFCLLPTRLDWLREATADLQDLCIQLLHLVPHLLRIGGGLLKLYARHRSREHGMDSQWRRQLQTHTVLYASTCLITRIAPFCFDCTECSSSSRFFWSGRVLRATRSNSGSCFSTVSICFVSAYSNKSKCNTPL